MAVIKGEQGRELRVTLAQLSSLDVELKGRVASEDPLTYNLPDLLRFKKESESDDEYKEWQDRELKLFVEGSLWYTKNAVRQPIKLAPPMLAFIADLFYQRVSQAILWKPRGGGGSLCGALLIWLLLVYRKLSVTDMAGSQEQSRIVYEYTKGFWNCTPELSRNMLASEPLVGETRMKSGVVLKTISATEKQARGKHNPVFLADESCQAAENTDAMIMAGMQGAMSEPKFAVILLSTFHHPIGLFQEIWDFAEERGFSRYKWDVYDVMEKCTAGMETATEADPKALEFCQTQCPLTEKKAVFDDDGVQTGWCWSGCNGRARKSEGFMPRKNVIIAKKMNRGTNVFEIEFECQRPNWMRPVYNAEWIEEALSDDDWPPMDKVKIVEKSIGIDWGLEGQTCLVLSALVEPKLSREELVALKFMDEPIPKHVAILECEFMSGKLTSEALKILMAWVEKYGMDKLHVYGDASHPFNNLEVENAGFDTNRVLFGKWKDYGVGNCIKYFTSKKRIIIRSGLTGLIDQLKRYRQDKNGRPIKKDDHGPDALLCAMLHFQYEDRFGEDLELTQEDMGGNILPAPLAPTFAGQAVPAAIRPELGAIPAPPTGPVRTKSTSGGQVVVM